MISGGEGRRRHCTSHCRHQQAQMKVMSNHYVPGPFGMWLSQNLLVTSKTQVPTSGTPTHGLLPFTLWKVSHINNRSHSQHVCSSLQCNNPLQKPPFEALLPWQGSHLQHLWVSPLVGQSCCLWWGLVLSSVSAHSSSGCYSTPGKLCPFSQKIQLV